MESAKLDKAIGEATELVMLWRKETRKELAVLLGMSSKSLNRRIAGAVPWEAWEIQAMAKHYGVPVERFYGGPDAIMGEVGPSVRDLSPAANRPQTNEAAA